MKTTKSTLSVALGTALAASLGVAPLARAADNPFAMNSLAKGYAVADAEGNSGGMKKGRDTRSAKDIAANKKMMKEGKCAEGKCGVKNLKEGKCGNANKSMEGKCAGMKM